MNILITSASNKVWLVQAFRRALINHGGGEVTAADINENRAALYFADRTLITPENNHPDFIASILKYCKNENIQLIIPTRDGELKIFSENTELFKKNNIIVMVSEPKTIEICLDKFEFYRFCKNNHIDTPDTCLPHDICNLSFPVFIKPRFGSGSRNTYIAKNSSKLEQYVSLYDETEFVIQEYHSENEYSIDVFSDFNGNTISMVIRQRIMAEGGESVVGKTENNLVIRHHTEELLKKLKLKGQSTIQCFYNSANKKVRFIEVNPRFGGGSEFSILAGADSPTHIIKILKGERIEKKEHFDEGWLFKYSQHLILQKNDDVLSLNFKNKKTLCFDIDGTLCTEYCQYENAEPIRSVINKINRLYNAGHKIILFTSRGYSSGKDWLPLLRRQMKEWGVSYHEIKQGKPFADYYIDNKSINIFSF